MVSQIEVVFDHQASEPTELEAERMRRNEQATASAHPAPPTPVIDPRAAQDARDLVAAQREMKAAVTSQIEYFARGFGISPAGASERIRSPIAHDVLAQGPEQVDWSTLANLIEHDPARAMEVWRAIKQSARTELHNGARSARAVERLAASPMERAEYLVILEWLMDSLKPQTGLETMLVQQLAIAYEQYLRWQGRAVSRAETESCWAARDREQLYANMRPHERDRYEQDHSWMPPRLSDIETIDHTVMTADRYQRSFLRILRAIRDLRCKMGPIVLMGGQLNVADRQINVNGAADPDDDR